MLNSYVDDILDLGRIEGKAFVLNNSKFELSSLCQEVQDIFELELKYRRINFDIVIDKSLESVKIVTDKDRVKQVII